MSRQNWIQIFIFNFKTASSLFNFAQYFKQSAIGTQAVTGSEREREDFSEKWWEGDKKGTRFRKIEDDVWLYI